jgi:hypothetical protein
MCTHPALYITKGCTRFSAASDKVYQLLAHGRWFSPGTPDSSTAKTGRHDIPVADRMLKVSLNTKIQIQIQIPHFSMYTLTLFSAVTFIDSAVRHF